MLTNKWEWCYIPPTGSQEWTVLYIFGNVFIASNTQNCCVAFTLHTDYVCGASW